MSFCIDLIYQKDQIIQTEQCDPRDFLLKKRFHHTTIRNKTVNKKTLITQSVLTCHVIDFL